MSNNRHPVKKFFVTFPKSGEVSKQELYDFVQGIFPMEGYFAVQEKHADGSPHIHAICVLKSKVTKRVFLNRFTQRFPDDYKRIKIEPIRSVKLTHSYLTTPEKDKFVDTDPLSIGDIDGDDMRKLRELYAVSEEELQKWDIQESEDLLQKHKWNISKLHSIAHENELKSNEGPWDKYCPDHPMHPDFSWDRFL